MGLRTLALCGVALWGMIWGLEAAAGAAEPAFVGKLALIADPEVAKELGLTDDVKKKLLDLINKREGEAQSVIAKLKGQPLAKQAEALAPFVAESEKQGKALLTDEQLTKLDRLRVAKEGMLGVLAPDIAAKLQLAPDQTRDIAKLVQEFKTVMNSGSEFQKRVAPQSYERKIASVLNDTQRASWEQLSGVPAGGSATAPTGGAAGGPAPGAPPTGATANSGPGGVNVQRGAGDANLNVTEDGRWKINFEFTPWKNVLEYFARKGGYSFATDAYPPGTLNYSDPRPYTTEEVLDVLNLHLMTKGFMLVKREKLLRLFDVANNGPVPPEFVPMISPDELENHGEFELVTVTFQLNRFSPSEASAEITKRLGPYGSITVLNAARQIQVTDLGGKLRWIKRQIEAVEQPDAPKDEKVEIIRLTRLTPTEFVAMLRPLLGIPDNQWATTDVPTSLRLAINELDSLIICNGKAPMIEKVQELAKKLDAAPQRPGSTASGIAIVDPPQFAVYQINSADPVHAENVIRTLLAGSAPDLRVQLDQATGKLAVWGRRAQHLAIQAILQELEQNGNVTEVVKLRKLDPQTAVTSINQLFATDPTGKSAGGSFRVTGDQINMTLTMMGTPAKVERAKQWLISMGEMPAGPGGAPGMYANADRSPIRVMPLSLRTSRNVINQIRDMWSGDRAILQIDGLDGAATAVGTPGGREALTPRSVIRGAPLPRPNGEPAAAPAAPPKEVKPAPPAKKGDFTLLRPSGTPYYFVNGRRDEAEEDAAEAAAEDGDACDDSPAAPAPAAHADAASRTAPTSAPADEVDQNQRQADRGQADRGQAPANAASLPEIRIQVTPGSIIISSDNLDALDEFQRMLEELIEIDERRGKRMEVYYLRFATSDTAATLLREMLTGDANINADNGSIVGNMAANMLGGMGGMGGLMGQMLGGGGGGSSVGGTVTSSASGGSVTVTSDPRLNALYVTAMPRDLDNVEQFLQFIDMETSPEPPQPFQPRFIPVKHGKAADVAQIVREVYSDKIAGNTSGNRPQINPQELILGAIMGGRGGRGGPGMLGRNNQQNRGEAPKMSLAVLTESNSLVVTAPDYLFEEVKRLVEAMDVQNIVPDLQVRVVNLKRTNSDAAFTQLGSVLGQNATITRVMPFNSTNLAGNRGGQQNNQNRTNQTGQQTQGGQFDPATLARMQQQQGAFNNFGQRGGRGGGPGNFGGNNFGGRGGGGGPGGFGGNNFGGNNFGGRGGGGGGAPGGFGGNNFGGRGGGGGGNNFGGRGGGGGGNQGGRGGGGIQ